MAGGPDSPSRRTARGASPGFTLLEAIVALALVGFGVLGALEATSRTLRTQAEVGRHLEAVTLADAALDRLSSLEPDSLREEPAGWHAIRLGPHRYRQRVGARPDSADPSLWRVTVEVRWDGGDVRLGTYLYRPAGDLPRSAVGSGRREGPPGAPPGDGP